MKLKVTRDGEEIEALARPHIEKWKLAGRKRNEVKAESAYDAIGLAVAQAAATNTKVNRAVVMRVMELNFDLIDKIYNEGAQ